MRHKNEAPGREPGAHNRTLDAFKDSAARRASQALDLADIRPNPDQPRKHFGDLTELATAAIAVLLLVAGLAR